MCWRRWSGEFSIVSPKFMSRRIMSRLVGRKAAGLIGGALLISLASCTDSSAPVPASVQAVIDAEFPADGALHVRSRGRLEIRPGTIVCRIRATVDPDLRQGAP